MLVVDTSKNALVRQPSNQRFFQHTTLSRTERSVFFLNGGVMSEIPILRMFKNKVDWVVFDHKNKALQQNPVPGYYKPSAKILVLAQGLDDDELFLAAYTILLKHLHPKDPETLCRQRAKEKSGEISFREKNEVVEFLESKESPLKLF